MIDDKYFEEKRRIEEARIEAGSVGLILGAVVGLVVASALFALVVFIF